MMSMLPLREIAAELQSDYFGADIGIAAVSTDSRSVRAGDLYVALQGERFDGHDFLDAVEAQGAAAAIVRKPRSVAIPQLQVDDTRAALGLVARMNRRQFQGPVIGITGSAGKTTCKEMVAAILGRQGPTLATQGNLNNEIGVPLTLLGIAAEHRYAVIEMGAACAGDIAYLAQFAEPDIAVVTAALPAHLEGFGSVDTIARTKGEIYAGLRAGGTAVVDAENHYADLWRGLAGDRRVITFGFANDAMVHADAITRSADGTQFNLHCELGVVAIALPLLGLHNVRNALAAAAAAIAAGAALESIRDGLAAVRPVPGRLCARAGLRGEIVIDDSYNANPGAVKAAIDVLAEYAGTRQLILGNMAELGPQSEQLHLDVARHAAERGIEILWCVGPHAHAQTEAFMQRSAELNTAAGEREADSARLGAAVRKNSNSQAFADNAALIAALNTASPAAVLVKGSRSAGTEVIVAALCGDTQAGVH